VDLLAGWQVLNAVARLLKAADTLVALRPRFVEVQPAATGATGTWAGFNVMLAKGAKPVCGGKAGIAEFTELRWITVQTGERHHPF
jgi:hypothetical protein